MESRTPIEAEKDLIPEIHDKGAIGEVDGFSPFPIVGIGASAGGLEAFSQFLAGLPVDTGMAFVLIQHLDPHHESRLAELLAKSTAMTVVEAADGMTVSRDHVYVIPPGVNMAISKGALVMTPRPKDRGPHLPVDFWLRSLAEEQKGRAIGVVLSGTGSDGTLGLCEIKAVGGITFAQDESTARHGGMPQSAVDSGCVDFVLTPAQIADRLTEIGHHPYLAAASISDRVEENTVHQLRRILAVVRSVTGVDFALYRDTTIKRRIMRRMALHTMRSWGDYFTLLQADRGEVDALYHDLLINVTSFFRDADMFETLKELVFPEILRDKTPGSPIRLWVPGCSTGQEAYSLAIALLEFLDDKPIRPSLQIFATDLSDQKSLDKARAGIYPESIEAEVSPERLRRFFKREDHVYRIDKSIRDSCVFARQNVTADPPFSHLDLISCRNVLIYLSPPLQKRVLPIFHYALNVPGFLLLGAAETVGDNADLFDVVDRDNRIYSKKSAVSRLSMHYTAESMKGFDRLGPRRYGPIHEGPSEIQREADRVLLGRYAPPGVIVNDNLDILQFRGRTSPYLEAPAGEPTTNILKMAREGLFLELRSALAEARKGTEVVNRDKVRMALNGTVREVSLEVVPIRPSGSAQNCYLILFHEGTPDGASSDAAAAHSSEQANLADGELADERMLLQLRQELAATKEYLQSLVEQQDAANEELRSANEEVLSSNEELQSTNEEMETAKEELQSANEELTTVNEQLQHRNLELTQANNDVMNLMSSTNIPVVMVGIDLRIRRFTTPARKVMRLLPSDVGRPIGDIKPALLVPDLEQLLVTVIETAQPVEREIRDRDNRWYAMRLYPYLTADDKILGAVLVLLDVDQIRRTQEELRRQATLLELSQDAVIMRDELNQVTFWNRGAQEMFGWPANEAVGEPLNELLRLEDAAWQRLGHQLERGGTSEGELWATRRDGTRVIVHDREVLVRDESGARAAVLSIQRDITERKQAIESLKQADRRKDEFLATLAHEIRNPLSPIRNAVEVMRLAGEDAALQTQAREVLFRQVRQLSQIAEDLIDVSRIVEKKIDLRLEPVSLAGVIDTAVESCRSMIEACRHRLHVSLPPEAVQLTADPVRLTQVVVNLINNSVKYTPPGGDIWLSAETVEPPEPRRGARGPEVTPGTLRLRVADNGIGIGPDLLPHVFEMFTQGEPMEMQVRAGLGVGLSLVRSLVQMHGGQITARSEGKTRGSEFVVDLPVVTHIASGRDARRADTTEQPPAQPGHRRILIVDDNRDHANSLAMIMKLDGHEVQVAHDGKEALELAIQNRPEAVLLDIGIPELNGYEVARGIRQRPELDGTLLIAQTGWGQEEDRQRSREAGFDHHLVKPVDMDVLRELLATMPGGNGG